MQEFLACMKQHQGQHIECKALSKKYLECRMNKGLMQAEELERLGFDEAGMTKTRDRVPVNEGRKEGEGFVAGLGVKRTRYKKEDKE